MSTDALRVEFWDDERGREVRYNFASLDLPANIARAFATAFKTITGAYRAGSRRHAWYQVGSFARYLTEGSADSASLLSDPNVLLRYKEVLLRQKRLKRPASRYNFARQLLQWLVENEREGPWRSAIVFSGSSPTQVLETNRVRDNAVSAQLLHRIAAACKREIDHTVERFGVRERLLRGEEVPPAELGGVRADLLRQVLQLEAHQIYTRPDFRRIHRADLLNVGLRRAETFRALTGRTALPYYVLLIINTCGNPDGIRNLEIDCLQPHPTDALKRRIYWGKHRSQREQAYDVLASGRYSAARCVADLLRLTEPIRSLASTADAHKLMLTRKGHTVRRICSLYDALGTFRTEHSFPYFIFADLRKAAAAAIDEHSKSSRAVKKALQHRSSRTSWLYLQADRSVDRRYESVLRYQGQMVALANTHVSKTAAVDTLAGLRCRDPLSGVAPGSTKNQPCLQWLECCRCPNAIVVRDDPRVIARIVRAAQSLQEMRVQAAVSAEATQHFESAFRPTLHVIETQILPRIAKKVLVEAEALAARLPALPLME